MIYILYLLIVFVGFGGSFAAFGQPRKVGAEELKKLILVAAEKRLGVPQRQKINASGYVDDVSVESLYEFGPADTLRVVSTYRDKGVETRSELIRVGTVRYTRENNGAWVKKELPTDTSGRGSGSGGMAVSGKVEATTEYLFVGTDKIDGQKTKHYRIKKKVAFPGTPVRTRRTTDDYWFREDGMLIRQSEESGFDDSKQRSKLVTEYSYDQDIKIVAPIP